VTRCTLEHVGNTKRHAVRLATRMVKDLGTADVVRIVAARMNGQFESVDDMWRRSSVPSALLVGSYRIRRWRLM
jgi:error-prone DNA polymerase